MFGRIAAVSVVLGGSLLAAPPVHAGVVPPATGRVSITVPLRVIDTRPGAPTFNGVSPKGRQRNMPLPSGTVAVVVVFGSDVAGTATVGPCAGPAPVDADFVFEPADSQTRRVYIEPTPATCLISTTDVHVMVDVVGTVGAAPTVGGLQYHPAETESIVFNQSPTAAGSSGTFLMPRGGVGPAHGTVVYRLDVAGDGGAGYLTLFGCDLPQLNRSDLSAAQDSPSSNIAFVAAGHDACLFVSGPLTVTVTAIGWLEAGGPDPMRLPPTIKSRLASFHAPGLVPIAPRRILDTRRGIGAPAARLRVGGTVALDLNAVTTLDTTSVVMNVTSTESTGDGYVTVFPCDDAQPVVSNLNFAAGQDIANLVTVSLGVSGTICFFASAATHLVADLAGTFEFDAGALGTATAPQRILDTRRGVGSPAVKSEAGQSLRLVVAGRNGIPASGVQAVTMNVTVTAPDAGGYLTVYPCDQPVPDASNLNFTPGQDVPNLVTVKLAADGSVCLRSSARTHVIADVAMWFGVGGTDGLYDVSPTRVVDTRRAPAGAANARPSATGRLTLSFGPLADGLSDIHAVVMNTTVTRPSGAGYLTAFPCDQPVPDASNLNFTDSQDVPNLVVVKTSTDGTVCLGASVLTDVLVDLAGFFSSSSLEFREEYLAGA